MMSLSKFYSLGDPLFLGHSPSSAFSTNELFRVLTGFRAISHPIRCLQSNSCPVGFGPRRMPVGLEKSRVDCVRVDCVRVDCVEVDCVTVNYVTVNCTMSRATTGVAIAF
jgi:hypothetical protein